MCRPSYPARFCACNDRRARVLDALATVAAVLVFVVALLALSIRDVSWP